jgi:four helix bundle protein
MSEEHSLNYKDLPLSKKARELVVAVDQLVKLLPSSPQGWVVGRQLFRATTSIGANIAEGRGRGLGREYERFLTIARGSANEVDFWLQTLIDCNLASADQCRASTSLSQEVLRLLSATIRTLEKKRQAADDRKGLSEATGIYSLDPDEFDSLP